MIEWLRPLWLLALPAGLALLWAWWRARAGAGPWRRVVDPLLLPHLVVPAPARSTRLALGLAALALALACVALAGPAWRAQPAPLYRDFSARIVVLDLSPSMDAADVAPSRLERARAGVAQLLRDSADAQLGLVVFGADAFTVAPLMSDPAALVHLLASLETHTLPRAGSRPDLGLDMARTLLQRARVVSGDVILVGDSAGDARTLAAARALGGAGFPVSVLAVGTPHGGPVRLAGGALAKAETGEILVTRSELDALEAVARAGGGRFRVLPSEGGAPRFARSAEAWAAAPEAPARKSALRHDDGAWFALLALPFAALLFRRGWLLCVAALCCSLPAPPAQAFDWADLWRRADQQAADEFAKERFGGQDALLEKLGPGSPWRGLLLYRAGRFAEAAAVLAHEDGAEAHYNRGNALALDGRLEAALAAYGAALEHRPHMRDALFNRALVHEALARRRAGARGGAEAQSSRPGAPSAFAQRPEQLAGGRGAQGDASRSEPQEAHDARQAQQAPAEPAPEADAARGTQAGGVDAAELRRLERLLAEIPDDPGSLLAKRFARQLRSRGTWHYDTGGRW